MDKASALLCVCAAAAAASACGGADGGAPPDAGAGDAGPTCIERAPLQRGGPGWDAIQAITVTGDGLLIAAGYQDGTAPDRFAPSGPSRGFVTAYGPDGALRWDTDLDTDGTDSVDALASHAGALFLAGHTSDALPGFVNAGQLDLVLARIDATSGALELLDQRGTERPQRPRRLHVDGERIIAAGMDDLYVPSNFVEAWQDPLIVRWQRDGTEVTRGPYQTWGTEVADWIDGLGAFVTGGDLVVSGTVESGPERGPFVTRIGPDGERRWTRTLSPTGLDSATVVLPGAPGQAIVLGSTSVPISGSGAGGQDVYLARIDLETGALVSATQLGSSEADWVVDAIPGPDGGIILVGETLGVIAPGAPVPTSFDLFVVVTDAAGDPIAAWQGGTSADDHPTSVAVDGCGTIFIAGWTTGELVPGQTGGQQDGFLMSVTPLPVR